MWSLDKKQNSQIVLQGEPVVQLNGEALFHLNLKLKSRELANRFLNALGLEPMPGTIVNLGKKG